MSQKTDKIEKTRSALTWFEIPAIDLPRAARFYERILGTGPLRAETMGPAQLAVFPYAEPGVGGCLMLQPGMRPNRDGTMVYLHAPAPLAAVVQRIREAGGEVLLDRTELPGDLGVIAQFVDTEGNRVGLNASS